jgi:Dolichyl-phosphate-mannose-protein mannosyltransferase
MLRFDRLFSSQDGAAARRRLQLLAVVVLTAGLCLRLYHYLSDPSIWFDEAVLMLNVEGKGYAGLLGPLDDAANGPPLFLWLEKGLLTALGDHPWAWRLPAVTASCLGLLLFFFVARRVLSPAGLVWAVGLFALSDRVLWHTVEVRPYTIDALVAVGVLAAWLWTEGWPAARRILLFAALSPFLLCLSYPAAFVSAGPALLLLVSA